MTLVTRGEAERVAAAITEAEQRTSGEIVAVITAESGGYWFAPVLWAAVAALLIPWPLIAWTWWPVQWIYAIQVLAFAALAVVLNWRPLRYRLVPRSIKRARAHRRALEQFLAQNLHTTASRTGVLLFVSVAERHAELVADAAIDAKVPHGEWQSIVDRLTELIGQGRPGDGFVEAVEAIGRRLAEHFPPGSHNPAELPNHLIVLPAD